MTREEIEFVGYFWGEGCISIQTMNNNGNPVYRLRISISTRSDDDSTVRWAKDRFGGYLYGYGRRIMKKSGYVSNPVTVWIVDSRVRNREILRVLSAGVLQSKKQQQVRIATEFLDFQDNREHKNHKLSAEQIETCNYFKSTLQNLKRYV